MIRLVRRLARRNRRPVPTASVVDAHASEILGHALRELAEARPRSRGIEIAVLAISILSALGAILAAVYAHESTNQSVVSNFRQAQGNCDEALLAELRSVYRLEQEKGRAEGTHWSDYGFLWTADDQISSVCVRSGLMQKGTDLQKAELNALYGLAISWQSRAQHPDDKTVTDVMVDQYLSHVVLTVRAYMDYINSIPLPGSVPAIATPSPTVPPEVLKDFPNWGQ